MTRFDVSYELVTIKGEDYKVIPLTGEFLPIIFRVMKTLNPDNKQELTDEDVSNNMSEEVIKDIHFLCFKTLEQSYPAVKKDDLERFVTKNMFKFYPAVLKVNLRNDDV